MHRSESPLPASRTNWPGPGAVLQRVCFWLAVVLPAGYVPLLAAGLNSDTGAVLAGLVALNLVSLLVGHEYAPQR